MELVKHTGKIYLCGSPTNMSLGLPGLAKKVRDETKRDPKEKAMYIFVNKKFTRIKCFFYDKNGFAMFYKHVSDGVFRVERTNGYRAITGVNVRALLASTAERLEEKK